MIRILVFFVGIAALGATMLEQRIDEVIRTARSLAPATIGVEVIQLRSGKVLYSRNAEKLFTPASNTKLFSTALALSRLGRDYRMTTRIFGAAGGPDMNGRLPGDLVLFGAGDPSISQLSLPYEKDAKPLDATLTMDTLADQVAAKGVREIAGDIVGNDSAWPWEPYPPGWAADDSVWEYGAPVGALTFNNGMFRLSIQPGELDGDPAVVSFLPALEYFSISNRVRTSSTAETKVEVERPLGSREVRLTGVVRTASKGSTEELAVDDPALFAATALYEALIRRGVRISGAPRAHHREQGEPSAAPMGHLLVERPSPTLIELLRVTDKVSQNLWAEMSLREVARQRTGDGSRKAGLDELKAFLAEFGAPKESYLFEDGSGLSRLTMVSPSTLTRLLRFMYLSPLGEDWKSLLPVGGVDGTLSKRFAKNPAAKAIFAKTGSLSHVNALSGYVDSATYGELTFSIIVNQSSAPASEVRAAIDRIALVLVD